jgi:hypothetical protein
LELDKCREVLTEIRGNRPRSKARGYRAA